ncbi:MULTISPECIES: D-2-hydroxyacid dehydrogenase [unclassified Leifsonia]|uniref:D-2-hydroxyacid dehydrogenase n=1 Tax=unclassified Leifsonia TaxID=2663824 RepID=UPI0008A72E59|nr:MULTISPECIES: D-2-hydroxyacid dehydrogenase [unclassified Leifsonia]SEH66133.1 Phosphoglycerate dehydrogenase [Leifsonia sp. CL154]SFL27885.1 Phosphoglycerate dehydrogenase [Leifsonia sp. CL147]
MSSRLRVAVAAPLTDALHALIETAEPRVELMRDASLVAPKRWDADFSGDPGFRRTPEQQSRFEALLDSADALYGIPDVDPDALSRTIKANPGLRWVHTMAAGGGGQVRAAGLSPAELERVAFTTSAGVHGGPLAEFAVFGILAGAKDLPRLIAQQRARTWSGRWAMGQVADQTILVLGLGGIGGVVARRLSDLGATVLGVSRRNVEIDGVDRIVHPDDIVAEAPKLDAVVSTLPGTDATHHLLGGEFFAALSGGTTIVNVGRGNVIDEAALVEALDAGRAGFAALDVFEVEPLPDTSPLWSRADVLISPHTAALDAGEERRIAELFADNAGRLLDGRLLRNRVDTVEFY